MARKTASLPAAEAFTIIVLFSAIGDGSLDEQEMDIIVNVLARMNTFRSYRGSMKQLLEKSMKYLLTNPGEALGESIASLPKDLHDTAFAVSVDIIMSDGNVSESEENAMLLLADKLSVTKAKAKKIIEVMIIKNKG
ncbi:tellurite resistance TerB family protein [Geminocystis herdmanii]|uniref:tellurite resistance TerB family protein n=1 Tax=Geminocystis herdmanii TaxID=669359 RepID=UPI0003491036|nr:tellurite resistance TerB family protein [Geminocystis herdmanii]